VVGGILALLLLAGVLVFTWVGRRMHQAVEAATQTAEQYKQLQQQFPFKTPLPQAAATPESDRLRLALEVRAKLQRRIGPNLRQAIKDVSGVQNTNEARLKLAGWLRLTDELKEVATGNQADLREAKMSPKEFSWLLGGVVAAALTTARNSTPEAGKATPGAAYWDFLRQLEQISKNSRQPMKAGEVYQRLQARYPADTAPAWAIDQLANSEPALYLIDLLIAGDLMTGKAIALPTSR
jgi:hypothetical protein